MIDNALAAGCLREVLAEMRQQEIERLKFEAWLIRGQGVSFEQFKQGRE